MKGAKEGSSLEGGSNCRPTPSHSHKTCPNAGGGGIVVWERRDRMGVKVAGLLSILDILLYLSKHACSFYANNF